MGVIGHEIRIRKVWGDWVGCTGETDGERRRDCPAGSAGRIGFHKRLRHECGTREVPQTFVSERLD